MNKTACIFLTCIMVLAQSCSQSPTDQQNKNSSSPKTEEKTIEKTVQGDAALGKNLFLVCTACHGQHAEGTAALHAPALANQEPWYLKRQLENFRSGKRGVHELDVYGAQMSPMSKTLADETAIVHVIAYIKSQPPVKTEKTIDGDIDNGASYYNMICGACHGPGAKGNKLLHSPNLIETQDWYLHQQIQNFRQGIRGTAEGDTLGAQMQQISLSIPDDKMVDDLVAYIHSKQN